MFVSVVEASDSEDENDELGGLFRVARKQKQDKFNKGHADGTDCSRFPVEQVRDWEVEEVKSVFK